MVAKKDKIVSKETSSKTDKPTQTKAKLVIRKPKLPKFIRSIGGYFKGAWAELRLVRWPDRKSSWGLTGAVIIFTAFFITLIVLLDAGFEQLFKLIIN